MRSAGGVGVKGESMPRSAVGRVGARAVPEAPDRHPGDSTVATDWIFSRGLYTTPALVHTWLAARRALRPDNLCWWLWLSAVVLMYGVGCAMVTGVTTGLRVPTAVNAVVIGIIAVLRMVFGVYWAVLLVTRLEGQARRAVVVGLILAVVGLANALVQTTQGLSGFALPVA